MAGAVAALQAGGFQDEVLESSQPVVVDFYADWCAPCKVIEPMLVQLAREYEGWAEFVRVDIESSPEIAARYGIMSLPSVLLFAHGIVQEIVVGASASSSDLKSKIETLVGKA